MYKKLIAAVAVGGFIFSSAVAAKDKYEDGTFVVDTPKIMAESAPSALGRKHIEDVQKSLQGSIEEVKKAWEKANEQQRNAALNDAFMQLNRQLELEKMAVNRQILEIIQDESAKWRNEHKAKMIISKDMLLAVSDDIEITGQILDKVNKRTPEFGEMPKVTVKQPKFDAKGNVIEEKKK